MKTTWIVCLIMAGCLLAFAQSSSLNDPTKYKAPKTEIAELEALIAQAKAMGMTPDPAWTTRIRELVPMVKGHPGDVVYDLPSFDANGGFAPGAVIRPQELTPLEQQIKELEFEIDGGSNPTLPDEVTYANLKEQLNELYAQREVRDERDPLDQGTDVCPALTMVGVPISFTGTTTGYVNNYNPITQCVTPSNAADVIYQFTPIWTATYQISLAGSTYDTYLYVNTTGACPGTVQVGCDDDGGPGVTSLLTLSLNGGQTYYIIVDGYLGNSGNYSISLTDNCDLSCLPGDVLECFGEVVDTVHAMTDCNGACNNVTNGGVATWQDIFPCQTICGRGFTYTNAGGSSSRDTDFYRFTLTEACSLRLTLNSEFPTRMIVRAYTGICPTAGALLFDQIWTLPCSTVTYITPCLPAGTYQLFVAPSVFTGILAFRDYRVRMDLIPCSGCKVDAFIQAPGSAAWNTCFAGNDNNLRPSQDYTYCVNIPYTSDWTFSTCNDDSIWDSFIYLTNACNFNIFMQDDDGCGGVGLSVINCVRLLAGTYYLTVEGFDETSCGPFVLNVSECFGSCCYGDPSNPICSFINYNDCDSLNGLFTYFEPCSTGACYVRPQCDADAQFGQEPYLPDEDWNGYPSDYDNGVVFMTDNYAVSSPIGSIRFWGFPLYCSGVPENFSIIFGNTPDTCGYGVTVTGTQLVPLYGGLYNLTEYYAQISPPCTILTGTVSIAQGGNEDCSWYWSTSPFDDGIHPGIPVDFAFCLGAACEVDSTTFIWDSPGTAMLRWYQSSPAAMILYYTTDPNAVYPAGFLSTGVFGNYGAGNNQIGLNANFSDYLGCILVADCTPAAIAAAPSPSPVLILRDESK